MAKDIVLRTKLKGANKTKKGLKGIDSGLRSLGKSALAAGAAYFGARGIISGFKAVIDASGQQELAEKKLETALGRTSKTLLNYASSLQKVTAFGDEATIEAMSMMAAFTKDEEALKRLTAVTLDYAAATGTDLNAAAQLVGRTFGTSMNAMSRYGVTVEGAAGSTERLESLTGNLANMFGGQAKAQADTMSGSIEQMKNAIGDSAESIGVLLAPAVIKIAKGFKGAAEAVSGYITQLRLSNTTLEGIVDTEERIAVIEAKLITTKETMSRLDKMGSLDKRTEAMLLMGIKTLEDDLAVTKMGNFFEFTEAGQAELDRLQKIIDHNNMYKEALSTVNAEFEDELDILGDIEIKEGEIGSKSEARANAQLIIQNKINETKKQQVLDELKQAALVHGSAKDAMKAVVRAETMEAVAGYISSVLKTVPFPLNLVLAAGGGAVAGGLMDKALSSFATGGDFVTSGPQMMMVGDNPGGRERVQVTPIGSPNIEGPQGGITLNISAPLVDETVIDHIIPAIQKAQRLNLA